MERFYKNDALYNCDPTKTFVQVDNGVFRKPYVISIENIGNMIKLKISDETLKSIENKNVSAVKFSSQGTEPNIPPNIENISKGEYICVDENYIYVWIPRLGKWKRAMLSDW